jgi:hypothetical protein
VSATRLGAPELSLPRFAGRAWERIRRVPWLGPVLAAWIATRIVIVVCALIASWLVSARWLHHAEPALRLANRPLDLLAGWDGGWYRTIATHGYPTHLAGHHGGAVAFFPLLPMLLAGAAKVGIENVWGALLVTNLVALAALCAVASVTASVLGDEVAGRTAVYLAISPLGFVLGMVYSEPLALACGFGAVAFALRGRMPAAAVLGLLAGLSRPSGFLFAIPLLAIAVTRERRSVGAAIAGIAPIAGLGAYAAYLLVHTGDALAFEHAQASWGRRAPGPFAMASGLARGFTQIDHASSLWALRDAGALFIFLALLAYAAWRRLPTEWIVYGLACLALPLASGATESLARFALLCIPAFWALALLGRRPAFDQAYRTLAPAMLAIGVLTLPVHWP